MYYLCTIRAAAQCLMPLQGDIIAKTIYNIQYPIPKPFKASTPFRKLAIRPIRHKSYSLDFENSFLST